MRVLTITELLRLARKELCDLAAQFTAALANYPAGSPEHTAALTTLRNIRFVLARRDPAPG